MTTSKSPYQECVYTRQNCAVFYKTKEQYGGLSNMAGGFPLIVNGSRIKTCEALYQACRFPYLPDLQRKIIGQASPMSAKMVGKPFRKDSRPDWAGVRVDIMRWCIRLKLVQNWDAFGGLLLSTEDRPIVEESRGDAFWGATSVDASTLRGVNTLGKLLMELRDDLRGADATALRFLEPLELDGFLLFGEQICVVADSGRPAAPIRATDQPSMF